MLSFRQATKTRRHEVHKGISSCLCAFVAINIVAILVAVANAQSPHFKVGRTPTPEEIKAWDIAIGPDGRELPPGRGTVARGKVVYAEQGRRCHVARAVEGRESPPVGG